LRKVASDDPFRGVAYGTPFSPETDLWALDGSEADADDFGADRLF
jgi:hypothetical protein